MSDLFPLWLKIIFILCGILGLVLLIKSISKMLALYNNPNSVEFSALLQSENFALKEPGDYEIAVKSPYLFGILPTSIAFRLIHENSASEIPVTQEVNFFSQRKNMSGERIVPIATFSIKDTGNYQLQNPSPDKFREREKLLITPKTGSQGFLLIFAILFSAFLFIGGMVMSVLSFLKK